MSSDIRFYIPESETIPTELRLYVGDILVTYEKKNKGFIFYINLENQEKALEVAKTITQQIILEHDESQHGVTWETVSLKAIPQEERYKLGTIVEWKYRIRDSY